jgi:hypothetical protein
MSVIAKVVFTALMFFLAAVFCYLGLASNGSLLGKSPTYLTYAGAIAMSSGYFIIPLLIASSCSPFISVSKLPWLRVLLVCVGAWADYTIGNSFAALLIFPYNIAATWSVAIGCLPVLRNKARHTVMPMFSSFFVISLSVLVMLAIYYSKFTEREAQRRATDFCAKVLNGEVIEKVKADISIETKNEDFVRWIQVYDDSAKQGESEIRIDYRGISLENIHECALAFSSGVVVKQSYHHQ